jgi:hypothetical protein
MDLGPLLVLGLMWLVVNAIRKAGTTPPTGKRPPDRPRPPVTRSQQTGVRAPSAPPGISVSPRASSSPPVALDPTQREGARLEQFLRQLGRTLEEAAGPVGRAPDRTLPSAEEQEEGGSLEVAPEVQSLETDAARPSRQVVDQDDEAAQIVARRLRAAEAHGAPRTRADHRAFDARIRQGTADKTADAGNRTRRLREAVIWREILGPPVSLRDGDPER